MQEVDLKFIEEAKDILNIEELTLEEKLNIIIYVNITRGINIATSWF